MVPTHVIPYRDGELRIGWASWDDGHFQHRSVKWAYYDKSGKISRGSPEIPFDILLDMVLLGASEGELDKLLNPPDLSKDDRKPVTKVTLGELAKRRKLDPWQDRGPTFYKMINDFIARSEEQE